MEQRQAIKNSKSKKKFITKMKVEYPLHLMLIPGIILVFLFSYIPMFGIIMAFQDYNPLMGFAKSPWVGWDNFTYMMALPDTLQVV
ncbi:MAG: hypothetical protein ACRC1P_11630 [Cellulosilyticaceae bacterium]